MTEDLFGSFAGISSYNAGNASAEETDSWLIKQNGMLLGPMTTGVVNNKMLSGEIDVSSLAAPEDSEDFAPLKQIAVFKNTAIKAQNLAAERAAKKKKMIIIGVIAGILVLGGGALGVASKMGVFDQPEVVQTVGQKGENVSLADIPTLKLVALVDIEKAVQNIKVKEEAPVATKKSTTSSTKKTKTTTKRTGGNGKAVADEEDDVVAGCQLPTQTIIGIVQKSAGKWVSCIQNLAQTEPNMVPDKLILNFTVPLAAS